MPRTHTSTACGGRGLRPRGYCKWVLEGCAERVPPSCPGDIRYSSRAAVRAHLPLGYCERYRVPHGAGPLQGAVASVLTATCGEGKSTAVRRCVRAHAGVLTDTNGPALARTRTARHRARRAHRRLSLSSADSAAGIVPSSEFEAKSLQSAWFVPLCSEMLMHRSVPRTHTSTACGCRGLRPRGDWTRVLEGGAARVPSSCPGDDRCSSRAAVRAHRLWYVYAYSKGP
jgi:hypothetical protein